MAKIDRQTQPILKSGRETSRPYRPGSEACIRRHTHAGAAASSASSPRAVHSSPPRGRSPSTTPGARRRRAAPWSVTTNWSPNGVPTPPHAAARRRDCQPDGVLQRCRLRHPHWPVLHGRTTGVPRLQVQGRSVACRTPSRSGPRPAACGATLTAAG